MKLLTSIATRRHDLLAKYFLANAQKEKEKANPAPKQLFPRIEALEKREAAHIEEDTRRAEEEKQRQNVMNGLVRRMDSLSEDNRALSTTVSFHIGGRFADLQDLPPRGGQCQERGAERVPQHRDGQAVTATRGPCWS